MDFIKLLGLEFMRSAAIASLAFTFCLFAFVVKQVPWSALLFLLSMALLRAILKTPTRDGAKP